MNTAKHVALPDLPEPDGWRITDGEGGYDYTDESPDEFRRAWAGRYSRVQEPLFTEAAVRAYAAEAVRVALDDAAADLAQAVCDDCENGVQWLSLAASEKFAKDYLHLRAAISNLAKDRT